MATDLQLSHAVSQPTCGVGCDTAWLNCKSVAMGHFLPTLPPTTGENLDIYERFRKDRVLTSCGHID